MEQIRIPLASLDNASNDKSPKIINGSNKNQLELLNTEETPKTATAAHA